MARKLVSNIAYGSHLESVSRKFVPKKETCSGGTEAGPVKLAASGWMGGGVRTSGRAGLGSCERNYVIMRANARLTQPTPNEIAIRTNFTKAVQGRNAIKKDLEQFPIIQIMWIGGRYGEKNYEGIMNNPNLKVNGVSGYGYTLWGWVMAAQFAGLQADPTYDANTFPTDYDA